jgi:hypothetical protein
MLTQNLHHFSNPWYIFCFLTQSFNMYKKINVTNLVDSTQNAFLSTMYVWTMHLRKLLENQNGSLDYAWSGFNTQCCPLHPMLHVLLNTVMADTESTFHITQYMSLADNTRNLTLTHAYASSVSNMVLPWLHKLY